MKRCVLPFVMLLLSVLLTASCYHRPPVTSDAWTPTEEEIDSISFYTTHHYTVNYNFRVKADSMQLIVQQPTEAISGLLVDTIAVMRDDGIVVADILTLPIDTVDSVWVQVARDEATVGWIHESEMLLQVAPDNPVSYFIDFFSSTSELIMMAIIVCSMAVLLIVRLLRHRAPIVHFNDIGSFYPSLLALLVAVSAVFYSSIQLFAPDSWRHFYYHPTLNPFSLPLHLALFVSSVWSILIAAVAVFDDVRRLPFGDAVLYWLGLGGVCAVVYVVFSVSTLYYIGYPLLIAYAAFSLWCYFSKGRTRYTCGQCGHPLREKGVCPHCGAKNV